MNAPAILAKLHAAGITVRAEDGQLRLTAGRGTLTPDLLSAVRTCKAGLLEILQSSSLFSNGPGVGGQCAAGVRAAPIAFEYSTTQPPSKADVEWSRFLSVAERMPDGSGWYDPTQAPVPVGISGERLDAFVADFSHLGERGEA